MIEFEKGKVTRVHLSANIDWLLRHEDLSKVLTSGSMTTDQEYREWLYGLKKDGYECIPMGKCDNFDPKTGCLGHPSEAQHDSTLHN